MKGTGNPCDILEVVQAGIEAAERKGQWPRSRITEWLHALEHPIMAGGHAGDAARDLRIRVMRLAQAHLPVEPGTVSLARLAPFDCRNLDRARVERLVRDRSYGRVPILVMGHWQGGPLELLDGRHRVAAARRAGRAALFAVRIAPPADHPTFNKDHS